MTLTIKNNRVRDNNNDNDENKNNLGKTVTGTLMVTDEMRVVSQQWGHIGY